MDKNTMNIPAGWDIAKLEEVCEILDSMRKPINANERASRIGSKELKDLYPYYGATGQVGYIDNFLIDGEYVLLGEDGAPFLDAHNAKAYLIKGKSWVNNHAHILKAHVSNKYILFYLNQFDYKDYVTGTTRLKLNQASMKEIPIKLAPVDEQVKIVEKIEQLFSEIDTGTDNLEVLQKQLGIYRQAILKSAFEGRFTEEWRKKNLSEDASYELSLINEERYEKSKVCFKKVKDVKPIAEIDLHKLPQLPADWAWIRAGSLYYYVTSGSRGWAKYYSDTGAIFVRITNLDFNSLSIDLSEEKIQYVNLPDKAEGQRTKVDEGDFLFSITGYLGMFAIAPKLDEAYVNQHIALCKPVSRLNKKYFGYWVMAKTGGNYYINKLNKGATKAGLTLDDIQNFYVPLCSLEEQNKIVEEIEKRMSQCENIERIINESLEKVAALKQSILKKAFEGKLIPEENQDNLFEAITQS